jgi:hypothetical protein
MRQLFAIRRGERVPALLFACVIFFFQYLIISKFWCLFADFGDTSFTQFMRNFHMSGFDPITYDVVTRWHQGYDILRHPLLALMMYPLYLLNQLLWSLTGSNCVQLVVGVLLSFCGFYSVIFLRRIMCEIIGIKQLYATLLSLFFLSFAYIIITIIVPDHFCFSLFCLLLTAYAAGRKIKRGGKFTPFEAVVLFFLTAGITLSNGAAVLLMILITNGRSFFSRYMLLPLGVSVLLLALPVAASTIFLHDGKEENIVEKQLKWTGRDVSRTAATEENFFGESLILHRKHILGDVLRGRPVIVTYGSWVPYAAVSVVQLLFLVGLFIGFRRRFAWLLAGVFLFNVLLHIGLGFAIDEVYIMASHWCFVLPLAIAYIFTSEKRWLTIPSATATCLIGIGFFAYNGCLLYRYLTWPLIK